MKQFIPLIFFSAVLPLFSAETQTFPEKPAFREIRSANMTDQQDESIQSAKVIYSVVGAKESNSYLMFRARRYDRIRVDVLRGKEHYCACRDGKDFWFCDSNNVRTPMTQEEAKEFTRFIGFLPVSFQKEQVYSDPVRKGEEMVNGVLRTIYESRAMDGSGTGCRMSVENKSHDLRKIWKTGPDDGTARIMFYRSYKTVDGIRIAGKITVSRVNTNFEMTLQDAQWNQINDDAIFRRTGKNEDPDLAALKLRKSSVESAAPRPAVVSSKKKNVEYLENQIRKQKLEIKNCEDQLAKMEQVLLLNRKDAVALASLNDGGSRRYWVGYGWGSSRSSSSHTRKKLVRKMTKASEELVREYEQTSDKLLRLRSELSENEYALKRLQGK